MALGLGLGVSVFAIKANAEMAKLLAKASDCHTLAALEKEFGKPAYSYHATNSDRRVPYGEIEKLSSNEVMMYAFSVHHFPGEYIVARVDVSTKVVTEVRREHMWW